MEHLDWIAGCLAALVGYLLLERIGRDRALAAIPVRVHVNGTRGKSTVTRLIWAALREGGIPAAAKTTGTAARLLLPDGSERPWTRRGPANILEQLRFLAAARRAGAKAVVVECMALRPDLQEISERRMLRSTLGVITNARTDHTEVMGTGLKEIARALAETVPRKGTLVLGETGCDEIFARRAAARETRVVRPALPARDGDAAPWLAECRALAMAACRELGVPEEAARRGMRAALPDPGAARTGTVQVRGAAIPYLDATAANDPESLVRLLGEVPGGAAPGRWLAVYNHRSDRPERLLCFLRVLSSWAMPGGLVLTGDAPCLELRLRSGGAEWRYAPLRRLAAACAARLPEAGALLFCGNTRGLDAGAILGEVERG